MRVVILIQARINSTRLPGKVVKPIAGLPLLVHVWRRMLACREADDVRMSAAGMVPDEVNAFHALMRQYVMRGAVFGDWAIDDLLMRHTYAAENRFDAIVRITADCLFHDPRLIDVMIRTFRDNWPKHDALVNWNPRTWGEGVDAEVVSMEALARLDRDPKCPREDFVTYMVNCGDYRVGNIGGDYNDGDEHLSIDTQADVERAEKMLKLLGNDEWRYDETMKAYREVTK